MTPAVLWQFSQFSQFKLRKEPGFTNFYLGIALKTMWHISPNTEKCNLPFQKTSRLHLTTSWVAQSTWPHGHKGSQAPPKLKMTQKMEIKRPGSSELAELMELGAGDRWCG